METKIKMDEVHAMAVREYKRAVCLSAEAWIRLPDESVNLLRLKNAVDGLWLAVTSNHVRHSP